MKPTVICLSCNSDASVLKKSPHVRLLCPSPRKIMFVVAIENMSSRNSMP